MASDTNGGDATGDEVGAAAKDRNVGPVARRLTRNVRRARSLYEGNQWQPSKEAEFLMEEATLFALVDLASAIREQNGGRS
jgi:hypothetical protein